ncbi:MAG: hypothetical protein M1826_005141 [Phylliscum demangeonii]|nr:MAG: hypothetical protein M1826_005141 [Phylliscum demangeonii]
MPPSQGTRSQRARDQSAASSERPRSQISASPTRPQPSSTATLLDNPDIIQMSMELPRAPSKDERYAFEPPTLGRGADADTEQLPVLDQPRLETELQRLTREADKLKEASVIAAQQQRIANARAELATLATTENAGTPMGRATGAVPIISPLDSEAADELARSQRLLGLWAAERNAEAMMEIPSPRLYHGKTQRELTAFLRTDAVAEKLARIEAKNGGNLDYLSWEALKTILRDEPAPAHIRECESVERWICARQGRDQSAREFVSQLEDLELDMAPMDEAFRKFHYL